MLRTSENGTSLDFLYIFKKRSRFFSIEKNSSDFFPERNEANLHNVGSIFSAEKNLQKLKPILD